MAPEYVTHGQYSIKSDVYIFGILLLEIVTGRKRSIFEESENYSDILSYVRIPRLLSYKLKVSLLLVSCIF